MPNKERDFDHRFKSRENNGEHRNGRLSQFKNHHSQGGDLQNPNEYLNKKDLPVPEAGLTKKETDDSYDEY